MRLSNPEIPGKFTSSGRKHILEEAARSRTALPDPSALGIRKNRPQALRSFPAHLNISNLLSIVNHLLNLVRKISYSVSVLN